MIDKLAQEQDAFFHVDVHGEPKKTVAEKLTTLTTSERSAQNENSLSAEQQTLIDKTKKFQNLILVLHDLVDDLGVDLEFAIQRAGGENNTFDKKKILETTETVNGVLEGTLILLKYPDKTPKHLIRKWDDPIKDITAVMREIAPLRLGVSRLVSELNKPESRLHTNERTDIVQLNIFLKNNYKPIVNEFTTAWGIQLNTILL